MEDKNRFGVYAILLVVSFFAVGILSLGIGQVRLPFLSVLKSLFGKEYFTISAIVVDIRLPRFLVSASVGAMLSISGLTLQTLFRNPLVDPYFLGVSSAAEFGIVIAILFGANSSVFGISIASIFAFLSAALLTAILVRVSLVSGVGRSKAAIVLIGIAISYIFSSVNNLLAMYKKDIFLRTTFWSMKGFNNASISQFYFSLPFLITGFYIIFKYSKEMNIYMSSDITAHSLGINLKQFTVLMLVVSALLTSVSVVVSGTIIFIGLFVPHMGRILIGEDRKELVIITVLLGAVFLPLFDLIARSLLPSQEIPINTIVSMIGAPFFLYLFFRRNNEQG